MSNYSEYPSDALEPGDAAPDFEQSLIVTRYGRVLRHGARSQVTKPPTASVLGDARSPRSTQPDL